VRAGGAFNERIRITFCAFLAVGYTFAMTHTLIAHEQGYTEVNFAEPPGVNELVELNALRPDHPRILVDLSKGIAIDFNGLKSLLAKLNDLPTPDGAATAIFVQDNLEVGLSTIFQDLRGQREGLSVKVFQDKQEAADWLAELATQSKTPE
jgi:hypothetical protein